MEMLAAIALVIYVVVATTFANHQFGELLWEHEMATRYGQNGGWSGRKPALWEYPLCIAFSMLWPVFFAIVLVLGTFDEVFNGRG